MEHELDAKAESRKPKPALLAFECITRTATACVMEGGREVAFADLGGGEAERGLVSMLDGLIRTHGVPAAFAVAAGPGSFTGLRIAITAVRTLAWIEQLPVHPVDALAALAVEQGDGLWWSLLPLKKDTTFHGLFRVSGGMVQTVAGTVAATDALPIPIHPELSQAVAIGPALTAKPGLAERWCPGIRLGTSAMPTARGVARLAPQVSAARWDQVLPEYHQEPAPVLQRRAMAPPSPRVVA